MSVMDNIVLASLRNRIGGRNLKTELKKLEKAHQSEMRMIKTVQKRYLTKFGKNDISFSPKSSEAFNVRMYETHNPGFCYHKNGECRIPDLSPKESESAAFQVMRDMLFTSGEVDIEKVLCLHLLAAHSPQSDTASQYDRKTTSSCSGWSRSPAPYRRANQRERSFVSIDHRKRRHARDVPALNSLKEDQGLSKTLPRYVIDINNSKGQPDTVSHSSENTNEDIADNVRVITSCPSSEEIFVKEEFLDDPEEMPVEHDSKADDDNLEPEKVSLYVNNEVEYLVDSVMEALKEANPQKIREMLIIVRNPIALRHMLEKPEIIRFMDSLRGNAIICGSKSFRITAAKMVKHPSMLDKVEIIKKKSLSSIKHNEENDLLAVSLEIPNTSDSLVKIVGEIRRNILREAAGVSGTGAPCPHIQAYTSVEPGSWRNLYRKPEPTSVNNSKIALAGSIAGSSSYCGMSLETLGSGYTLSKHKDFSTDHLDANFPSIHSLMDKQVKEIHKSIIPESAQRKFSMRRATCPACAERWRFQVSSDRNPLRSSYDLDINKPILDRVTRLRLSRDRASEQKVVDDLFKKLRDAYVIEDLPTNVTSNRTRHVSKYNRISLTRNRLPKSKVSNSKEDDHDSGVKSVLRRMSNPQRILVGMKAASMKSHHINIEGIEPTVKSPLREFVAPVLSKESILALTTPSQEHLRQIMLSAPAQGGSIGVEDLLSENSETLINESSLEGFLGPSNVMALDKDPPVTVTPVNRAKLKQTIADKETDKKLVKFLNTPNP